MEKLDDVFAGCNQYRLLQSILLCLYKLCHRIDDDDRDDRDGDDDNHDDDDDDVSLLLS